MPRLLLVPLLLLVACDTAPADGGTEIVAYRGAPITRADAAVPDPPLPPAEWEASGFLGRTGSSVFLRVATTCGDECRRTVRFTAYAPHSARPDGLPESMTGVVEVQTYNPEGFESGEIPISRVEIQDWGPEVYSGVVYPAHRGATPTVPYVFWAESQGVAVE